MQPVDYTTLLAASADLRSRWLPARCEQVYQRDKYTLFIALRTIEKKGWLAISWHPQAARIHMSPPPPKQPDTFTFSQQLKHQIGGLALTRIEMLSPWERALDLQFARRPDEPALWHLYVEVMGKYSNVILTAADNLIVTAAHQVSEQQSSVRPIQTGQPYVHPPAIRGKLPSLSEGFDDWRDRISLIPGKLKKMLVKASSGVSSSVATQLIWSANLSVDITTDELTHDSWQSLFQAWQRWLKCLSEETFLASNPRQRRLHGAVGSTDTKHSSWPISCQRHPNAARALLPPSVQPGSVSPTAPPAQPDAQEPLSQTSPKGKHIHQKASAVGPGGRLSSTCRPADGTSLQMAGRYDQNRAD